MARSTHTGPAVPRHGPHTAQVCVLLFTEGPSQGYQGRGTHPVGRLNIQAAPNKFSGLSDPTPDQGLLG